MFLPEIKPQRKTKNADLVQVAYITETITSYILKITNQTNQVFFIWEDFFPLSIYFLCFVWAITENPRQQMRPNGEQLSTTTEKQCSAMWHTSVVCYFEHNTIEDCTVARSTQYLIHVFLGTDNFSDLLNYTAWHFLLWSRAGLLRPLPLPISLKQLKHTCLADISWC